MSTLARLMCVVVWLVVACHASPPAPAPPAPAPVSPPTATAPAPVTTATSAATPDAAPPAPADPVPDHDAWLEYVDGRSNKTEIFPVATGRVVRVGRSSPSMQQVPDVDLGGAFEGDTVSRRHAEIMQRDGTWMLFIQPDTTNRSSLNGELIDRGSLSPLKDGDEIQMGGVTVKFRTRAR